MSTCGWCKAEMPPGTEYEHLRACSSGRRVSDREAAIRAYIQAQPQDWQSEESAFLDNVYDLLGVLAAARERLTVWESLCMTPGQVEELREREAKLREARYDPECDCCRETARIIKGGNYGE